MKTANRTERLAEGLAWDSGIACVHPHHWNIAPMRLSPMVGLRRADTHVSRAKHKADRARFISLCAFSLRKYLEAAICRLPLFTHARTDLQRALYSCDTSGCINSKPAEYARTQIFRLLPNDASLSICLQPQRTDTMPRQLIDEDDPDSAEYVPQNQKPRDVKVLEEMKSTSKVATAKPLATMRLAFNPLLPDSEPWSAPGHVSREEDRISMAEAAPSNSLLLSSSALPKSRNASNYMDDESGSDSESRNGGSKKDSGQPQRPTIQMQALAKIGSWESIHRLRRNNESTSRRRMEDIILRYVLDMDDTPERTSRISEDMVVLNDQSRRRQEYLDDALYGHIENKQRPRDGQGSSSTRLEELIQRAELGIILRCRTVDPYARSLDLAPPKPPARLIRIVKNLYSAAWNHISALPQSPEPSDQWYFVTSYGFMENKCRNTDNSTGEGTIVDPFIDSYFTAMVQNLSDDLLLDIKTGRRRTKLDTLEVCEKVQSSRHNDRLTPAYMAWASSRLTPEQKEEAFSQWDRIKQQESLSAFRQLMRSTNQTIRQEFCADIVTLGVVSLVLFKGGLPSAVKDVTGDELRDMGWLLEECRAGRQHVRLDIHADTKTGQKYVVKISIDQKISAVRRLGGRQWIRWE